MVHYENYTLRDFLNDDQFIRWVKYPDAENVLHWETVRNQYPHLSTVMDHAANLIRSFSKFYPEVPDSEIEKGRQAILDQLPDGKAIPFYRRRLYLSVAASVAILIGIALWFGPKEIPARIAQKVLNANPEIRSSNDGSSPKTIALEDGSSIILSPKSSVSYNMKIADRREVHLEGEAFFNVGKNPARPFFVYAKELTTKVLGTKFRVSAYADRSEVKVEVTSGRVRVYLTETENEETDGLTLTPNQQAVFSKRDLQLVRSVVEQPKALVTTEQLKAYIYTDTPISKVFEGLEEIYGIKVIYDQEKFKNCRLNMSLSDESLFEKLELIGKMVEARYNVIDGEVIFIGEGCSE